MRGKAWDGAFQFTEAMSDLQRVSQQAGVGARAHWGSGTLASRTWERAFPALLGGAREGQGSRQSAAAS